MDVLTLIEKSVHVWWCNILIVHLCGDHITSSNRAPGLGGIKPYGTALISNTYIFVTNNRLSLRV